MTTRSDGGGGYPYPALNFLLEIDGFDEAGFSSCRVGGSTTQVLTYREGTDTGGPRTLPGRTSYEPVTLERGVTDSPALADWRRLVEQGEVEAARRPVAVVLLDAAGRERVVWECPNARPTRWVGPRLRADRATVATETLELAHDGVERLDG